MLAGIASLFFLRADGPLEKLSFGGRLAEESAQRHCGGWDEECGGAEYVGGGGRVACMCGGMCGHCGHCGGCVMAAVLAVPAQACVLLTGRGRWLGNGSNSTSDSP